MNYFWWVFWLMMIPLVLCAVIGYWILITIEKTTMQIPSEIQFVEDEISKGNQDV